MTPSPAAARTLFSLSQIRTILAGDGHEPLSEMRISQLIRQGMPKESRGQYDPVNCMFWYIGSLRNTVNSRSTVNEDGSATNLTSTRKRLLDVQTERAELDLARAKGEIITIGEHSKILADVVVETRARILAVAARVAPAVIGESSRVMAQAKIEKEIRAALGELSKLVPSATGRPPADETKPGIRETPPHPPGASAAGRRGRGETKPVKRETARRPPRRGR